MSTTTSARAAVIALAAVLLSTGAGVATAAPVPAGCTWQPRTVLTPPGAQPAQVEVTGAADNEHYSGFVQAPDHDPRFFRWVDGTPVEQPPPAGFAYWKPVAENGSGTVLLGAGTTAGEDFTHVLVQDRQGGHRVLPVPAEASRLLLPRTLNERGDVVARGVRVGTDRAVILLWRAGSGQAELIDLPEAVRYQYAMDIDEDGTVLLFTDSERMLWRDGVVTRLPAHLSGIAIRDGVVLAGDYTVDPPVSYLLDTRTNRLDRIEKSGRAEEMNSSGLVVGTERALYDAPRVWQGTTPLGQLPLPVGSTRARVQVVSADNVIFGKTEQRVVRWRCFPR